MEDDHTRGSLRNEWVGEVDLREGRNVLVCVQEVERSEAKRRGEELASPSNGRTFHKRAGGQLQFEGRRDRDWASLNSWAVVL